MHNYMVFGIHSEVGLYSLTVIFKILPPKQEKYSTKQRHCFPRQSSAKAMLIKFNSAKVTPHKQFYWTMLFLSPLITMHVVLAIRAGLFLKLNSNTVTSKELFFKSIFDFCIYIFILFHRIGGEQLQSFIVCG